MEFISTLFFRVGDNTRKENQKGAAIRMYRKVQSWGSSPSSRVCLLPVVWVDMYEMSHVFVCIVVGYVGLYFEVEDCAMIILFVL